MDAACGIRRITFLADAKLSQLSLNIIPRLPYSPENIVLHAGLNGAWETASHVVRSENYSALWISAPRRAGKTHLSVKLVDFALSLGRYPQLFEGGSFADWFSDAAPYNQLLIIDDADHYFNQLLPGSSGQFVNLIESLRRRNGAIVFLSSQEIDELPCDEHVTSRLREGFSARIGNPAHIDMPQLLSRMALQRGLALKENRIDFIAKRLRHEISYIERYLDRAMHLAAILNRSVTGSILTNAL